MPRPEQAARKEVKAPPDLQEQFKHHAQVTTGGSNLAAIWPMTTTTGTAVAYLNAPAGSQTYTASALSAH